MGGYSIASLDLGLMGSFIRKQSLARKRRRLFGRGHYHAKIHNSLYETRLIANNGGTPVE